MKRLTVLAICVGLSVGAHAGQEEAKEVFSVASSGALTFMSGRISEDISQSFMHYTREGRSTLITELERAGVLAQAMTRGASLRTTVPTTRLTVSRRVGSSGVDEFDIRGEAMLQWTKCDARGCQNLGDVKRSTLSGTVISVNLNGRPGYRVSSISLLEGQK